MKIERILLSVALASTAAITSVAQAAPVTVTLQNGVGGYTNDANGVQDTWIAYHSGSADNSAASTPEWVRSANGNGQIMNAQESGSGTGRAMISFNLSAYSGPIIGDANLRLYIYQSDAVNDLRIFQIAPQNSGWKEVGPTPLGTEANTTNGDGTGDGAATFFYKSIVNTGANTTNTMPSGDTTSTKWHSAQFFPGGIPAFGGIGGTPSGVATASGLWNQYDLVDANPLTPVNTFADMATKMDELDKALPADVQGTYVANTSYRYVDLTIPQAVMQGWIDDPSSNAGLLIRSYSTARTYIYTSEFSAIGRPQLTFTIPEPATLSLLSFAGLALIRRRK